MADLSTFLNTGATEAQGAKADTAVQPGDNISTLTNDSGYITDITSGDINQLTDVDTTGKSTGRILEFDASGNLVVGDKSATASTSFLGLTDTPGSYAGQSGKVATVNGAEDGISFTEITGSGLVDSVFGRIGPVVAQSGDYTSTQITNTSAVTGSSVTDALNSLQSAIPNVSTKMDKISSAVLDAIIVQDAFGNAKNSGVKLSDFADVATSGSYVDLVSKPTINSFVSGVFNIEDYGAVADGVTDNQSAINAAISAISSNGGGTLLIPPNGVYRTQGNHTLVSNMSVVGMGYNSCLKGMQHPTLSLSNPVFNFVSSTRPDIELYNISFKDLRIEGIWDEIYKEDDSNSTVIVIGVDGFTMTGCYLQNNTFGGLVLNQCLNAHVHGNWFRDSARDMCRLWNTDNSSVIGNTFYRNDDDCISINMAGFEPVNGRPRQGILVKGNYLQDTGSIRVQSASHCVIEGNVMNLTKGGAINVEAITSSEVYETNAVGCIIQNNIIANIVDRNLSYTESTNQFSTLRTAIKLSSGYWTTNSYDEGAIYNYDFSTTGPSNALPKKQSHALTVANNMVIRTLPSVANYSDWGYGKLFTRFKDQPQDTNPGYIVNGEADPQIVDNNMLVVSLEIRSGLENTLIDGNQFLAPSNYDIQLRDGVAPAGFDTPNVGVPADDKHFRNVAITNNVFRDFREAGVYDSGDYINTSQDITIEGNIFDGDPYFQSSERAISSLEFTGGWTSVDHVIGIYLNNVSNVKYERNKFMNVSIPWRIGSVREFCVFKDNILRGEPSTSADPETLTGTNRGIGLFTFTAYPTTRLEYVNCDPRTTGYDIPFEQPVFDVESDQPSNSYYFKGQTVWTRRSVIESSGKLKFGYRRATDGTSHVLNTDWIPLYADTTA